MRYKFIDRLMSAAGLALACVCSLSSTEPRGLDDVGYEEGGGNYYCYPWLDATPPAQTPSPAGYEPFHLEHYGRHGSR